MMHSNMKQSSLWNSYARPIFASSTDLWNFQNRWGAGPRDDVTALTLLEFQLCEMWWDDTQYDEADRYLKWPCSGNFCMFHGTLKFPEKAGTRSKGQHYSSNSLRISAIGLKISGMMHSAMKQIAFWNGHAQPFFARSMELWNFPW